MKYTLKEWQDEGKRRFGESFEDWRFVCPACGRINIGREYKAFGADPNDIYRTCIGRHNGNMRPASAGAKNDGQGCDWAAFGLLGTLGKGNTVITEDGKSSEVFAFAEATTGAQAGEEKAQ